MSTTMETAVGRFVWHDHISGDPERARAFYGELLGWQIEVWKPGELDYPMITAKGQGITAASGAPKAARRRTGSATSSSATPTRPASAQDRRAARSRESRW